MSTPTEQVFKALPSRSGNVTCLFSGDELLEDSSVSPSKLLEKKRFSSTDDPAFKDYLQKELRPVIIRSNVLISAMESKKTEFEKNSEAKISIKHFSETEAGSEWSSIPLNELRRLYLSNMFPICWNQGYLLCRIIAPAVRQVCVQFAIEDVEGNAQTVSLYHHPGTLTASPAELDTLFPVGMVLIIKNPYLSKTKAEPSCTHIRVDVPTDIILPEPGSEILSDVVWKTGERTNPLSVWSADEWKEVGDSHFKAGQFFAAAVAYSRSLKIDPLNYKVKMNRSLAHLRLENTTACLEDIEGLLNSDTIPLQDRVKTILRKGLALYAEMKFEDAKEAFLECLKHDANSSATRYLKDCFARCEEATTGKYDWVSLFQKALVPGTRLDVASFFGPIEMKDVGNLKGTAVYATKPIAIGEVLVVEKAFACTFPEDLVKDYHNIVSKIIDVSTQLVYLRQECLDKLAFNPQYHSSFFKQFAGNSGDLKSDIQSQPEVKVQLADVETFSLPIHELDIRKIHRIASINNFLTWFPGEAKFTKLFNPNFLGRAIFPFCAGFANDCYGNARWECWGDVIIVRASRDIKAGEEIKISHAPPVRYVARQFERLSLVRWTKGFKHCTCGTCNKARYTRSLDGIDPTIVFIPDLHHIDEWVREKICGVAEQAAWERAAKATELLLASLDGQSVKDGIPSPEHACGTLKTLLLVRRLLLTEIDTEPLKLSLDQRQEQAEGMLMSATMTLVSLGLEVNGSGLSLKSARIRDTNPLNIETDRLPFSDCGLVCLIMAEVWSLFGLHLDADCWMRTAVWLENKMRGGGAPLFRLRYANIMRNMGSFAEESLSRVEKGKQSPLGIGVPPIVGPSLIGEFFEKVMSFK